MQWNWPGNLRELENWIARAIILGSADALGAELSRQVEISRIGPRRILQPDDSTGTPPQPSLEQGREVILRALEANGWSRRKAARELNISYRSLLYSLRDSSLQQRRKSHKTAPFVTRNTEDGG